MYVTGYLCDPDILSLPPTKSYAVLTFVTQDFQSINL